jgi:2-polyprenyl-3-methyl-5-hydroxy-6-metoxy-1,4-benzoquinol methylase
VAGYLTPLLNWNRTIGVDWDYFSSLSLVVRSNVLSYGKFPLHDPWVGGGLDILANPQNRIFSPLFILDLLLSPHAANLVSLILYSFLGMVGTYLMLRGREVSRVAAVACAILFVNSSWFGLHFSEGHVPYGSFQLLPWVLYFAFRLSKPSAVFGLCSLLSLFLLDGGMYAFIFSLVLLALCTAVGLVKPWQALLGRTRREKVWVGLSVVCLALLSSAKLVPVLVFSRDRKPGLDFSTLSVAQLGKIFFYPFQTLLDSMGPEIPLRFHEFGCYLGVLAAVLVVSHLTRMRNLKKEARFVALAAFFFWVGSGWGGALNPWHFFQKLPLLNNAHVQSRVFLLMDLCFLVVLASALDRLRRRPQLLLGLAAVLVLEATFVKAYPFHAAYKWIGKAKPTVTLIRSQTIRATIDQGTKPEHYFSGLSGARQTYDPAAPRTAVQSRGLASYRGEIYFTDGMGTVALDAFTPGRIVFHYTATAPSRIEINSNQLADWKAVAGNVQLKPSESGLIGVQVPPGAGSVELAYAPWYLSGLLFAYASGILLWFGLLVSLVSAERDSAKFNYDGIPVGYYDEVLRGGNPIQRSWHAQKFERVIDCLPKGKGQSVLDIGCFSGSFLSLLPEDWFSRQLGVDILKDQIQYAEDKYGSPHRAFRLIPEIAKLRDLGERFDCVTSIEVIEHLQPEVVGELLGNAARLLKENGKLILTTPNYASTWPLLEMILNRVSEVSYEEQHITKFNYFTAVAKLRRIYPELDRDFEVEFKTTTHFLSPFLAGFSYEGSRRLSRLIPHNRWKLPLGNLLLVVLTRRASAVAARPGSVAAAG